MVVLCHSATHLRRTAARMTQEETAGGRRSSLKELLNGVTGTRRLAGHERAAVSLRESSQKEKKRRKSRKKKKKKKFSTTKVLCAAVRTKMVVGP